MLGRAEGTGRSDARSSVLAQCIAVRPSCGTKRHEDQLRHIPLSVTHLGPFASRTEVLPNHIACLLDDGLADPQR